MNDLTPLACLQGISYLSEIMDMLRLVNQTIPETVIIRKIAIMDKGVAAFSERTGYSSNLGKKKPDFVPETGMKVRDAVEKLLAENTPEARSTASALLDSAVSLPESRIPGKVPHLVMPLLQGKKVVFIGHFPHAEKLRNEGYDVEIIELFPQPGDIHWDNSREVLKSAGVVLITGYTIVNGTCAEVIRRTGPGTIRILMGGSVIPSAVFFSNGIHILGSIEIQDYDKFVDFLKNDGHVRYIPPEIATHFTAAAKRSFLPSFS